MGEAPTNMWRTCARASLVCIASLAAFAYAGSEPSRQEPRSLDDVVPERLPSYTSGMRLQRSSSNVSNSKTQVSKVTKPKAELKLERFVKNNIRKSMKSPYTAKTYPVKHQLRKQRGNSSKVGTGPLKMAMKSYSSAAVPRLRAAKKLERSVKQSVKAK